MDTGWMVGYNVISYIESIQLQASDASETFLA